MKDQSETGSVLRWNPLAQISLKIEHVLANLRVGWTPWSPRGDQAGSKTDAPADNRAAARLQALLDGALNGILLADDRGVYVDANPAICRMLGFERSELVGMTVQQLVVPQAQPDALSRRFLDERRLVGRVALRCKDGSVLQVDYMATTNIQPGLHSSVLEDATRRSETETTLRVAQQKLSTMAAQQHMSFEAFRAGLARDLHDELGQTLGALLLEADRLRDVAPASAKRISELVREGMSSVRDVSLALRPATLDLGLVAALRALAADTTRRSDLDVATELPADLPPLPAFAELMLFRIAQEALSNAVRHAGASQVSMCLSHHDKSLTLEVCDDGRGFDPAAAAGGGGLGLAGMRERAELIGARLTLMSAAHAGTLVRVGCSLAPKER